MEIGLQRIIDLLQQLNISVSGPITTPNTGSYTPTPLNLTGPGSLNIPAGVLSFSVTNTSGTITVAGKTLAVGQSVKNGGYPGRVSNTLVTVSAAAASTALVNYDLPA